MFKKQRKWCLIFGGKKNAVTLLTINDQVIVNVHSSKFLGTTISAFLKWHDNLRGITKKSHQKLYFLRWLKRFRVSKAGMSRFYRALIKAF